MSADCVFCYIIIKTAPAKIIREWDDCIAFVPLNPVVEGHILVVPRWHAVDAKADPYTTGVVFKRAAELIGEHDVNLIANVGPLAGQTVFHLHVHIVPRTAGDKLCMPWDCARVCT